MPSRDGGGVPVQEQPQTAQFMRGAELPVERIPQQRLFVREDAVRDDLHVVLLPQGLAGSMPKSHPEGCRGTGGRTRCRSKEATIVASALTLLAEQGCTRMSLGQWPRDIRVSARPPSTSASRPRR
ncbi:hypothetical protein ACFPH6_03340 [Streptomyces xiangluensis]|uniref:Uncharacterized protein n=1 Tax=Streptomyces xiangluensis TaxID=2665720 RepID=A0ABV8YEC8_9ACTN